MKLLPAQIDRYRPDLAQDHEHRSGYMFAFWQEQKAIPSIEGLRVMGTVDPHKQFKSLTYLLINNEGIF